MQCVIEDALGQGFAVLEVGTKGLGFLLLFGGCCRGHRHRHCAASGFL